MFLISGLKYRNKYTDMIWMTWYGWLINKCSNFSKFYKKVKYQNGHSSGGHISLRSPITRDEIYILSQVFIKTGERIYMFISNKI